jgi:hypothetical protein
VEGPRQVRLAPLSTSQSAVGSACQWIVRTNAVGTKPPETARRYAVSEPRCDLVTFVAFRYSCQPGPYLSARLGNSRPGSIQPSQWPRYQSLIDSNPRQQLGRRQRQLPKESPSLIDTEYSQNHQPEAADDDFARAYVLVSPPFDHLSPPRC